MGSAAGHSPHSCSVKFDESVGGFGWASNVLSNLPQSALWPRYCFTSIKLNGGEAFPCLISINIQSHALIRCSSIWETLPQKSNFFWIIKGNCFITKSLFSWIYIGDKFNLPAFIPNWNWLHRCRNPSQKCSYVPAIALKYILEDECGASFAALNAVRSGYSKCQYLLGQLCCCCEYVSEGDFLTSWRIATTVEVATKLSRVVRGSVERWFGGYYWGGCEFEGIWGLASPLRYK